MPRRRTLFQVRDPFGNEVALNDSTFHGHILPGHPEMANSLELIRETITDPYRVRQSTILPDLAAAFERSFRTRWFRVLVEYSADHYPRGTASGLVMTAYRVDAIIKAQVGKIIYQKRNERP